MSEWREDNFVERLAHSSSESARAGFCAEAEILSARAEYEGIEPITAKLAQHIERCPECSDLRQRVLLFDQQEALGPDADAAGAEQRLDSWMKGFLASKSLHPQFPAAVSAPKLVPQAPKARPFRTLQWALAAAAMIIITVGVLYIRRSFVAQTSPSEVARTAPYQPPDLPTDALPLPGPDPLDQSRRQNATPKRRPKGPKLTSPTRSNSAPSPKQELPAAPNQPPDTLVAANQPAAPESSPATMEAPDATQKQAASSWSTQVRPTLPPTPASVSRGLATKKTSTGVSVSAHACITCSPGPAPAIIAPPPFQIPVGTRIWISLQAPIPATQGQFPFVGTLLLPITISDKVSFEKGTSIDGVGVTSGKQTSFQITGIVFHAVRYSLQSRSNAPQQAYAAPSASVPAGSGKVLEFRAGKVAEIFLESTLTFVAPAANTSQPAPKSTTPP